LAAAERRREDLGGAGAGRARLGGTRSEAGLAIKTGILFFDAEISLRFQLYFISQLTLALLG
jgi:hypothetical protein